MADSTETADRKAGVKTVMPAGAVLPEPDARSKAETRGLIRNQRLAYLSAGAAFTTVMCGAAFLAYKIKDNKFISLKDGPTPLHNAIDFSRIALILIGGGDDPDTDRMSEWGYKLFQTAAIGVAGFFGANYAAIKAGDLTRSILDKKLAERLDQEFGHAGRLQQKRLTAEPSAITR